MIAEVIGFVAGAIGMMQALPQVRRVRALGHGRGVSLATWILTFLVNASWCGYGMRIASPSVTFTNLVAGVLSGSVVAALLDSSKYSVVWLPTVGLSVAATAASLPIAATSAVLVALTLSRTPQVVQSYRNLAHAHATAVSMHSLGVSIIALLGWEAFAVLEHRGLMLLTTSIALALTLTIMGLELAAGRRHEALAPAPTH